MKKEVQLNPINIIKIIATLCVFCLHTSLFSSQWGGFSFSSKNWLLQTPAWAAVWIFFFVSGYLNGGNFIGKEKKYQFSLKSIFDFYKKRLIKVILPTWLFIFVACLISQPEFIAQNPGVLIKILTLRYYNDPGCASIGATWYVFVLAQLYILTPIICFVINWIIEKAGYMKEAIAKLGIVTLCVLGFVYRFYMLKTGAEWTQQVYVPVYSNCDIYISGILLASVQKDREYNKTKYNFFISIALVLFVVTIIVNSAVYYKGNFDSKYIIFYQYFFPSIYIFILSIVLDMSCGWNICYKSHNIILKIIDKFTNISFEFYLVHSMVLYRISPYIKASTPNRYHLCLLGVAFVFSIILAIIFQNGHKEICSKFKNT